MLHVGPAAGALVEGALVGGVGEHAVGLAGTEATSAAAATTTAAAAATSSSSSSLSSSCAPLSASCFSACTAVTLNYFQ